MDIVLDRVVCRGGEASLLSCAHDGVRRHACDRSQIAGVQCQGDECTG